MAMNPRREVVVMRDAAIIYRNFKGIAKEFNTKGDRNFSVMMGEEQALAMQRDGWNIKPMKRQEEDDQNLYHLKVKVNFGGKPPRCWLITSGGRSMLTEDMVGLLDELDVLKVDLTISPYDWHVSGKSGRTAYLQSLYFTMYEDELDLEYAVIPQSPVIGGRVVQEISAGSQMAADYDQPFDPDDEVH